MKLVTMAGLKVEKGIPYTRQHIYRLVESGKFPKPIKLSENKIAFLESEIDDWIESKVQQREDGSGLSLRIDPVNAYQGTRVVRQPN